MPRRSRTPQLAADWVRPYWLERQSDPASPAFVPAGPGRELRNISGRRWTCIGTLDGPSQAIVDPRGLVTPMPGGWSVDWWIGAADRWHFPSREVAVRQRLVDDTPVVETAMRVPGGDVVHRAYAARSGDHELVVLELENESSVPVALALAVRPYGIEGLSTIKRIELDGTLVSVDGRPAVVFPRPPNRTAGSSLASSDVATLVVAGDDDDAFRPVRDDGGTASAAFVFALPHRTTLRVAMPLDTTVGRGGKPHGLQSAMARAALTVSLPTARQVANGWGTHGQRGMRVVLPDARLQSCVEANRRHLLVLHNAIDRKLDDTTVAMLRALELYGYANEVAEALESYGAKELRPAPAEADPGGQQALAQLVRLLDTATATWTWPDGHSGAVAAELLTLVRELLVREVDGGLALYRAMPADWVGLPVEVHDAPTRVGRLSYAVRWHGERPALLWELAPTPGAGTVTMSAPGLDPAWSSTELAGEALLAPVLPPPTPVRLSPRARD